MSTKNKLRQLLVWFGILVPLAVNADPFDSPPPPSLSVDVAYHELLCNDVEGKIVRVLFMKCALAGASIDAGCKCLCPEGLELNKENYAERACLPLGSLETSDTLVSIQALTKTALESLQAAETLTGGLRLSGEGSKEPGSAGSSGEDPISSPESLAALNKKGETLVTEATAAAAAARLPSAVPEFTTFLEGGPNDSLFERIHRRYAEHSELNLK